MKNIIILGSSGSIGQQALSVINEYKNDFKVLGLSVGSNITSLSSDCKKFKPQYVWVEDEKARADFIKNNSVKLLPQDEMVKLKEADIILSAIVGVSGLKIALAALEAGKTLALANKESMVTGGRLLKEAEKKYGGMIIPVDSEHSAIWQCLMSGRKKDVKKIILTASGGAFRDCTFEQLKAVTPENALCHPVWKMGKKVTIDSATLMNKGLEVIEAMYLFDVTAKNIEVVQHRQSIIHSMVEYCDNTVIACMSNPDMRIPIQLSLTYPDRYKNSVLPLDFFKLGALTFEKPNTALFPCLQLAYDAVEKGESAIVALNSANELLVNLYIGGKIGFTDIPKYNSAALKHAESRRISGLDDIFSIDKDTKQYILDIINL